MGIVHDIRRAAAAIPRSVRHHCILCDRRVGRFLPYRGGSGESTRLMRVLDVVGSDIVNFECPRCGGHDRERHLLMYLEASGLMAALPTMRVLHFAPERHLSRRIAASSPLAYTRCDLYPASPEIERVDIEAMPFGDGAFDLVIANHVLEHVDDDLKAVAEIARVLVTGGLAILQTPYSPMLHETWCDPGIVGEAARLAAYGQEDHVRLFGRDIFKRIASAGLESRVRSHAELLDDVDPAAAGVNVAEPFFLFRKK